MMRGITGWIGQLEHDLDLEILGAVAAGVGQVDQHLGQVDEHRRLGDRRCGLRLVRAAKQHVGAGADAADQHHAARDHRDQLDGKLRLGGDLFGALFALDFLFGFIRCFRRHVTFQIADGQADRHTTQSRGRGPGPLARTVRAEWLMRY
jgi:hypothetical protein